MNSHTAYLGFGAIALISFISWVAHRVRRHFEDRCDCGCLFQDVYHYIEPGITRVHWFAGTMRGTHTFRRCQRRYCRKLKYIFRERIYTWWSYSWRRVFKPWQFRYSRQIQALFKEAGVEGYGKPVPPPQFPKTIPLPEPPKKPEASATSQLPKMVCSVRSRDRGATMIVFQMPPRPIKIKPEARTHEHHS